MAGIMIETVPVGNPGNAGQWSGESYGGYGTDRLCGAVDYEYDIGKYEVTAGQYTAMLNAVGGVYTHALYNTEMASTSLGSGIARRGGGTVGNPYTYTVAADFANRPVNFVSWGDAVRFANWLTNGQPTGAQGPSTTEDGAYHLNGAATSDELLAVAVPSAAQRAAWAGGAKPYFLLTSEDEWYKAAYYNPVGGAYFQYPTGSNTAPGRDLANASGNNANYWTPSGAYPIDSGIYTTAAGEFQSSDSPYGTVDQGGNVWEWNESILYGTSRGLLGGSFDYNAFALRASGRSCDLPPLEHRDVGFRLSVVPEPGTAGLVVFVGLALLRRSCRK
jgi:formylglycine-generating enzyme required for sulfatase activity